MPLLWRVDDAPASGRRPGRSGKLHHFLLPLAGVIGELEKRRGDRARVLDEMSQRLAAYTTYFE
jgi:hypothetical protein